MAAIGDSEGTVTIMQLSKALYETTSKEKEIMGQIFDREFRREKNLLTSKKLSKDAGSKAKKGGDKKADAGANVNDQKEKISKIEEEFFNTVSKDEDLAAIKARGQMAQQQEGSAE